MGIKTKTTFEKIKRNDPYFEDFITRSVYHSNAIEGNTLSFAETYAIIFNDNTMRVNALPREMYEAINLKYALNYVLQTLDKELTLKYIEHLAILINKNIEEIGGLRTTQVFIRGAEHIPPDAANVPRLLQELLYVYRQDKDDVYHKLARFHLTFERIHPFTDGNGRTGRLLLTKELLNVGLPPLIIPLESRGEYMEALAKQNVEHLASMLKRLTENEGKRMKTFGISLESMNIF